MLKIFRFEHWAKSSSLFFRFTICFISIFLHLANLICWGKLLDIFVINTESLQLCLQVIAVHIFILRTANTSTLTNIAEEVYIIISEFVKI